VKKVVKAKNLIAFRIWLEKLGYSVKNLADGHGFTFSFQKEYGLVTCELSGNALAMKLGEIYHTVKDKGVGFTRLAKWYDEVERSGFKSFGTVSRSIQNNYQYILNFFENRNTNASAESFNAKIKAFRSQFRGVRDIPFFLFRLSKIYA